MPLDSPTTAAATTGDSAPGVRAPLLAALAVAAAGTLVAIFDLRTNLPLSDEWIYRWPLQRLLEGHGVQLWPGVQPFAAVQLVAALPLAALGAEPRLWRLSVLPFLGLLALFSWLSARALGAGRGRAALAAVVVGLSPLCLQVATGLMTDVAFLAMLMGAAFTTQRWLTGRGSAWLPAAFILLATLERTHGVGIPIALTAAVAVTARRLPPRERWAGLALCWGAGILGAAAPYLLGVATPAMNRPLSSGSLSHTIANLVGTVLESPIMAALLLLPLVPLLLRRPVGETRATGRLTLAVTALGVAALVAGLTFQFGFGTMIFPGDIVGNWGLGQLHLGGYKSSPWPLPVFYVAEGVVLAGVAVLFLHRRGLWRPARLGPQGVFLALLAVSQSLPMLSTSPTDRYHLAVAAPLAPLLVSPLASPQVRGEVRRYAASLLLLGVGLAVFVLGEQDYLAWQVARDAAAREVYAAGSPPGEVDAGYEALAVYVALPAVARTGQIPADLNPSNLEPRHPRLRLRFAPAHDPTRGVSYGGPAPGRIIVVDAGR